ncbi:hypothetical protein [Rhodococcus ruber]|uniref:hypothetical protein n=1 Tax=Rhodococcus ruber TaxID=1830 RepID=UPI0026604B61|nr:hypothetical protein [Rhodococcus ruber]MDO1481624.1 hypothetical protein [Rhodococcus ruber]
MNNVVAFRRSPKIEQPEHLSVIVVAGSGGAAATTTCVGLTTALRLGAGVQVAAIDGTFGGGILLDRAGVGPIGSVRAIRDALSPLVAAFVEVPFDATLARPGALDHRRLSAGSPDAWTDVFDALGRIEAGHHDTDHQAGTGELA